MQPSRKRTRPSSSTSTRTSSDPSAGAAALLAEWEAVLAVDHHCHPLLRPSGRLEPADLRRAFTEAVDPEVIAEHTQHTVAYRQVLHRLATELGCEPTEEGVIRAREEPDALAYANRLMKKSGTGLMILDHGFAGGDGMSPAEHAASIQIPQREVIRLETAAEGLVATSEDVHEWVMAVQEAVRSAVAGGAVGVKTIAAYRAGLRVRQPDWDHAEAEFKLLWARSTEGHPIRLEGEPLCHLLLLETAQLCGELGVPLQVHCGFGDPDEDLALTNPLGLRPLFVEPRFDGLRVVLLHCYPYHREAAYLASVFPGAYMDLSLAIPMAAHDGARALEEALGLCPTTKLLYATDATRFPEVYLVAAALHREALAGSLGRLVGTGWLTQTEAVEAGRQVLSGNAERIYRLR